MARHLRLGGVAFGVAVGLLAVLDFALSRPDAEGKKYAFLVGVNKYDKRGFPDLEYAERDVVELAKLLRAGGYEVVLLTASAEKAEDRATKANIQARLKKMLDGVKKADLVVLAFAGHGEQVEIEKKAQPFFCPRDAVAGDADSLIAINDVLAQLDKRGGGRNLVLIDACRNDPTPGRGRGIDGNRAEALPEGTAVLFSCSRGQRAFETKNAGGGHGVFFHFVLEGLRGGAARDGGDVTWDRLVTYVTENVDAHLNELVPKAEGSSVTQTPHKVENLSGKAPVLLTKKDLGETVTELPKTLKLNLNDSVVLELVLIDPKAQPDKGIFQMGSPKDEKDRSDDEIQRKVQLTRPYYLGKFHVTRGQFDVFVKATKYETEAESGDGGYGWNDSKEKFEKRKEYTWRNPGFTQTDAHPVLNVSWNDAKRFCRWLSEDTGVQRQLKGPLGQHKATIRLPNVEEWEYACRAGSKTRFFFGDDEEDLAIYGNVADGTAKEKFKDWKYAIKAKDGYVFTAPVGKFKPNKFGLYDMHGNAWQWCEDYSEPGTERRFLCGGSWRRGPGGCRAACRGRSEPDGRDDDVGFRVAFRLD